MPCDFIMVRCLFMLNKLVLVRVDVGVSGFYGYLYTSKLVKTILVRAYPPLEEHFKPVRGSIPKLIHITPLYENTSRGVKCIYSYANCRPSAWMAKCTGPPRIIELNSNYYFYLGLHESLVKHSDIVSALVNYNECFEFIKQRVCVETMGIEVLNPHHIAEKIVEEALKNKGVKIIFSSPTLLRDPLKTMRKHKTLLPTPINVFATPIYLQLHTTGTYRKAVFRRQLLRIHRLFNETYSILNTARVKWVYYTDKPIPALAGFANYRIDENYMKQLETHGVDVKKWLIEIFTHAITLGVGTGRATGFGHIEIKPLQAGKVESRLD